MPSCPAKSPNGQAGTGLAIVLMATPDGPPLCTLPVTRSDLTAVRSEAWRECCLRRGFPRTGLADLRIDVIPHRGSSGSDHCNGYALAVQTPDGKVTQRHYSNASLADLASQAAKSLSAAGAIEPRARCYYRLVVDCTQPQPAPSRSSTGTEPRLTVRRAPPAARSQSLSSLLSQAEPIGETPDDVFPVFYMAKAHAKAEAAARRGVAVESGAMLCGYLAFCETTSEFFPVITDVIEAAEAEETEFSLAYTGTSWLCIQEALRQLKAKRLEPGLRLLGNCHGHNFMPHRDRACQKCDRQTTCNLTSVFVSEDDQTWHAAVFAQQPWALCHIFGLNARGQPVSQLFTIHDGRLKSRGYYLIDKTPPRT